MLNIVFLDRDSLPVKLITPQIDHHWQDFPQTQPEQVVERCYNADVVITNKVPLTAAHLAQLPRLKLIAVSATGYNQIDIAAATQHKIAVCNVRGYAHATVPEHTLMLILTLSRRLLEYRRDVQNGDWQRSPNFCLFGAPVADLQGSTVTVVGNGTLGQRVAELCRAFGMRVLIAEHRHALSQRAGYTAFDEAIAQADIVSLHCPLNEQTHNLFDAETLAKMKRGALIINTARGGLIDESALLNALESGHIGGAGIDVLAVEPPRQDSILLSVLRDNLIVTPHIGWAGQKAIQSLADQVVQNIEAWANRTPRNLCN